MSISYLFFFILDETKFMGKDCGGTVCLHCSEIGYNSGRDGALKILLIHIFIIFLRNSHNNLVLRMVFASHLTP